MMHYHFYHRKKINIFIYTHRVEPEFCEWSVIELKDRPHNWGSPLAFVLLFLIVAFLWCSVQVGGGVLGQACFHHNAEWTEQRGWFCRVVTLLDLLSSSLVPRSSLFLFGRFEASSPRRKSSRRMAGGKMMPRITCRRRCHYSVMFASCCVIDMSIQELFSVVQDLKIPVCHIQRQHTVMLLLSSCVHFKKEMELYFWTTDTATCFTSLIIFFCYLYSLVPLTSSHNNDPIWQDR